MAIQKNPEIIEAAIRQTLKKPSGELTKADLKKVQTLDLGDTYLTDADLKELARMKSLRELELGDTKITEAGVAELQKALPKCQIKHDAKN